MLEWLIDFILHRVVHFNQRRPFALEAFARSGEFDLELAAQRLLKESDKTQIVRSLVSASASKRWAYSANGGRSAK